MTYYVTPNEIHSVFAVVENWSSTDHLTIDISMAQSDNIQHSRGATTTHDCIPPYHRQLIFITEWIAGHRSSSDPTYDLTYQHSTIVTPAKPVVNSYLDDLHTPRLF